MMKIKAIFLSLILVFNFSSISNSQNIPNSFADLAEKLMPSVVNISTTQTVVTRSNPFPNFQFPPGSPFGDMFKEFGTPQERQSSALGSGFIIDEEGLVVTNNHVIEGAEDIVVQVNGEKQPSAPGIFEASIRVPYQLQPGENVFLVKVKTRLGSSEKEFIVFLETDKVKREKEKPPFQMIVISEISRDDNFLSVSQESPKTAAYKGSMTLLSTLNKRFDHQSRTALNAIIMGDGYQEKTFKDYSVFFKQ